MHKTTNHFLWVLISLLVLCPVSALAGGTYIDPCGQTDVYTGFQSKIFVCALSATGSSTSAGTGIAGFDFFENHISPVHLSGFQTGDLVLGIPFEDDTTPTWDVAKTFTLLGLDGSVKVAAYDPNAYITLTLIGILGGCVNPGDPNCVAGDQQIGPIKFGPGTSTSLHIVSVVEQFTNNFAEELLLIDVSGNATYNVSGSPVFEGAVPEPSTFLLFGAASLLPALRSWLRRK